MSQQIAVRLDEDQLKDLDAAVKRGLYESRAQAIRAAVGNLIRETHEREIDEAYARAYREEPQEDEIGEIGLAALNAFYVAEERADRGSCIGATCMTSSCRLVAGRR